MGRDPWLGVGYGDCDAGHCPPSLAVALAAIAAATEGEIGGGLSARLGSEKENRRRRGYDTIRDFLFLSLRATFKEERVASYRLILTNPTQFGTEAVRWVV